MGEQSGKKAVVTGAGRGIGREIALKLAEAGADLAILFRKKPEPAAALKTQIEQMGGTCHVYQCDVSDEETVKQTFSQIRADLGNIDILVNNAGLASWGNTIHDTSSLEWDKILKTNLYGPYYCIREALTTMRPQGGGQIINISSSITLSLPAQGGPYTIAKVGLEALTKTIAKEETQHNIRINAIAPGLVETDMGNRMVGVDDMKTLYDSLPFGRACQPADIANMVLFLLSEAGSYIQGEVIYINGGATGV
ncbi:MAG: SDR family NAD(P)-dependent oxidoreductase [bacterium]